MTTQVYYVTNRLANAPEVIVNVYNTGLDCAEGASVSATVVTDAEVNTKFTLPVGGWIKVYPQYNPEKYVVPTTCQQIPPCSDPTCYMTIGDSGNSLIFNPPLLKPTGGSCKSPLECQSAYCGLDGKCAVKPTPDKDIGASCTTGLECKSLYCDPTTGKCAIKPAPLPDGATCMTGIDCLSGYCNPAKKCAPRPMPPFPDGLSCTRNEECMSGFCNASFVCSHPSAGKTSYTWLIILIIVIVIIILAIIGYLIYRSHKNPHVSSK